MAKSVPTWVSKDPASMTLQQLSDARKTVQAAVNAQQDTMNQLNYALMRLSNEVSNRFDINIPGVPVALDQIPPYPAEWVADYKWPDLPEDQPAEDPAADATPQ